MESEGVRFKNINFGFWEKVFEIKPKQLLKFAKTALQNIFGNANTTQFWDAMFDKAGSAESWGKRQFLFEQILPHLPKTPNAKILDVGCAMGDGCAFLSSKLPQAHISGCDLSPKAIAKANSRFPQLSFFVSDIFKEELPVNFDAVILISLVEHFSKSDADQIISKCLKHSSRVIISCPFDEDVSFLGLKGSVHLQSLNEKSLSKFHPQTFLESPGNRIIFVIDQPSK